MPATVIRHGEAAREALLRGIDLVADAVGRTLGPMGRHAVLERSEAPPLVTNDGVTIARSIERLSEPLSNQGVHLLREVADTTEDAVGDGTTTSILLARAIVREGARQLASGADPAALGRGIAAATREAQEHVRAEGRPLASHDELVRVAAVSSRDERIGELVAAAVARVGPDGVVRVQDDTAYGIRMELRDGMRFAGGLLSRGLATDANGREASFERPYVLAASERITQVRQLVPLLSAVVEQRAPLLIVADEVSGDALALLVLNVAKRRVPAIAVKAPEFGPDRAAALLDLAILTGGELLGPELGVSAASGRLEHLGRADRVVATLEECTLFGGDGAPAAVA
ncbi:MAG TPA: TCP-1/cpn60 chaperonin family protein, partial [Conexibacter sp.]|nr:TCP-1/cpn60 chaperonin family protein [Conexibacter sp.]